MNKKWIYKQKFFKFFYQIKANKTFRYIIKIMVFSIFLMLNSNFKNLNAFIILFKEIKNGEDTKLYLKNKTEFYYKYRLKLLKQYNISYNESKLITFQDKLNYLIIHDNPESKSDIVDKIKLDELPDKFVLKTNHGSGMNIICKDKTKFDINMAKYKMENWKNINYGLLNSEFQYFPINRKIFASPYLGDNLIDYEVYCFNNQPKFILVRKLLFENNHTLLHNYYDCDWNLTDIETGRRHIFRIPEIKTKKPKNLNLMLYYSKKLSSKFAFVRIDFYDINIIFLIILLSNILI